MNLDELQSVQARERQSSDLQHLRSSFYQDVGEFVSELQAERDEVVERADDPFSSPEVRRLSDDIETAEQTVEAIYERRIGKVVKKASIAAAGMPVDADGLTHEEEALFEELVDRIEDHRGTVLSVLDGKIPDAVDQESDDPDVGTSDDAPGRSSGPSTEAASAMGGSDDLDDGPQGDAPSDRDEPAGANDHGGEPAPTPPPDEPSEDEPDSATDGDVTDVPRTTVRITSEVGRIVGADDRDYELTAEDVVTLPSPNAEALLAKDAAERLE